MTVGPVLAAKWLRETRQAQSRRRQIDGLARNWVGVHVCIMRAWSFFVCGGRQNVSVLFTICPSCICGGSAGRGATLNLVSGVLLLPKLLFESSIYVSSIHISSIHARLLTCVYVGVGVLGRHRRCCIELSKCGVLRLLAENAPSKDGGSKTPWTRLGNKNKNAAVCLYECWVSSRPLSDSAKKLHVGRFQPAHVKFLCDTLL